MNLETKSWLADLFARRVLLPIVALAAGATITTTLASIDPGCKCGNGRIFLFLPMSWLGTKGFTNEMNVRLETSFNMLFKHFGTNITKMRTEGHFPLFILTLCCFSWADCPQSFRRDLV